MKCVETEFFKVRQFRGFLLEITQRLLLIWGTIFHISLIHLWVFAFLIHHHPSQEVLRWIITCQREESRTWPTTVGICAVTFLTASISDTWLWSVSSTSSCWFPNDLQLKSSTCVWGLRLLANYCLACRTLWQSLFLKKKKKQVSSCGSLFC